MYFCHIYGDHTLHQKIQNLLDADWFMRTLIIPVYEYVTCVTGNQNVLYMEVAYF